MKSWRTFGGLNQNSDILPVIAFTAAARDEDRAATRLAGFQAHLSKPIEPDELVRTVLELFNCK
jgi:CheY-like chemotaxis protein